MLVSLNLSIANESDDRQIAERGGASVFCTECWGLDEHLTGW
jgi:hypothetical protein